MWETGVYIDLSIYSIMQDFQGLAKCFLFCFVFYFTILYWFCHTSTCIHHGCTRVLHPEPPLPPPSLYHPSGSSQCTSPKLLVSCIEPGLAIHFLYDIIHFLIPFSQIIPQLPLPQSPKDCSIHLCLFCCLTYRVVITIFLNSIYMHQYTVLVFFFWLTSLCIIGSSFIHLIRTDSNVFFLMAE